MIPGRLALVLTFVLLLAGCDGSSGPVITPPVRDLALHVQCCFENEYLEVYADKELLLADTVTTDIIVGLTRIKQVALTDEAHRYRVLLNGDLMADTTFGITGMAAIIVRYDPYDHSVGDWIPLEMQVFPLDFAPGYD